MAPEHSGAPKEPTTPPTTLTPSPTPPPVEPARNPYSSDASSASSADTATTGYKMSPVSELSTPMDRHTALGPVDDATPAVTPPAVEDRRKGDGPVSEVYVCFDDSVVSTRPGNCPVCRHGMEQTTIANPDPTICPVTGKHIEHANYGIVEKKAYAFCSPNCILFMIKNPHKYLDAVPKPAEASR
ncbi:MAG TPA: hypothetical protein VL860_07280 [Planctomycetota bacterium]|nr:hypothetical protein [Planctomycetota bacterium]